MAGPTAGRLLIALYGPTSAGKTAISIDLAKHIEGTRGQPVVVISADSRQVYRYMDIGTSKTTVAEMDGIRHEMLDVTEPIRKLELEDYARLARGHIDDALAADQVPFIVGGTGIYVKALLEGWEVDRVGAARRSLRRDFPRAMATDAHAMLRRLDRATAARIHVNNYEAIINALASVMAGATPATAARRTRPRTVVLGLDPGPRTLDQRVVRTYDQQVRRGLYEEIQELNHRYDLDREIRRRGADTENQVLHTHGYREYFEVALERRRLVEELTVPDMAEVRGRVVDHIRRYSRRQRSWLRKLPDVRMVESPGQAFKLIAGRAATS